MTTEDRAYEAAARELFKQIDAVPEVVRAEIIEHAKRVVTAFLTAMGQEVQ